jgi:hypothetical protein
MPKSRVIRCLAVAVALLALLVLTTTGGAWHRHSSTETHCSICHLSHQSIEEPLATYRAPLLGVMGAHADSAEPLFVARPVFRRLPARAPPFA